MIVGVQACCQPSGKCLCQSSKETLTIAKIPALTASGSLGHASTIWRVSRLILAVLSVLAKSASDSASLAFTELRNCFIIQLVTSSGSSPLGLLTILLTVAMLLLLLLLFPRVVRQSASMESWSHTVRITCIYNHFHLRDICLTVHVQHTGSKSRIVTELGYRPISEARYKIV